MSELFHYHIILTYVNYIFVCNTYTLYMLCIYVTVSLYGSWLSLPPSPQSLQLSTISPCFVFYGASLSTVH